MTPPRSFPSDLCLDSPRLQLRPMRHADAAQWLAIMADPEVMRYWHHAPWQDLAEAESALAADREAYANGDQLKLGMYRRDNGELIGMVQLFNIDDISRRGEIGYCLASAVQGRGYMDEALTCFIDYLAHTLHHAPPGRRNRPAQPGLGTHPGAARFCAGRHLAGALVRGG